MMKLSKAYADKMYKKGVPVFWATRYRVNILTEILNICDPSNRWKFCWSAVYQQSPSLMRH